MAKNIKKVSRILGAKMRGKVPDVGGGAFGAARLAEILQQRLSPSQGRRSGRPTDPSWVRHPKIPMSDATARKLESLAEQISTPQRKVSPMQVAAQLLEDAVAQCETVDETD